MKTKFLHLPLLFAAGCLLTGCFFSEIEPPKTIQTADTTKKEGQKPNVQPPAPEEEEIDLPQKANTDNTFAFDLFRIACQQEKAGENVVLSPLSISLAFNMALNGAKGQTANEILTGLRESDYTLDQINRYSRSMRKKLVALDSATTLRIANAIWYRNGLPVNQAFIDANRRWYNAEVSSLDFNSPQSPSIINNWCAKQTENRIKEIVKTPTLDGLMYLVNAVYFKGVWKIKFDKKQTYKAAFRMASGQEQEVDMMELASDKLRYANDEHAYYLELPYGNESFSMVIALPNRDKTTADVAERLTTETWNKLTTSLKTNPKSILLRLPRFTADCEYELNKTIMPAMGMVTPFNSLADFSGITNSVDVKLNQALHKTFIEVNEEGTEAAAITSISVVGSTDNSPYFFIVDRPFLFAIRENSTNRILFLGRMERILNRQ